MESVEVKLYTVAQIRDWLEHNKPVNGLTNEVIRPAFAWSLMNHPDVLENDPIVAAIYDHGNLAASTCAFPEVLVKPIYRDENGNTKRIWWFPMLWVKKQYEGKGYGLVVIGSLAEVYGLDCAWTAWAVQESIEIFELLGCKTYYFPHYFMQDKHICTVSFRGKLAYVKQKVNKWWNYRKKPNLPHFDYFVRYLNYVDDLSYNFICRHSKDNFLLSSQRALNWAIQYPRRLSMPLAERVPKDGEYFQEMSTMLQYMFVQVWNNNNELIGVYFLKHEERGVTFDFIYYDESAADIVFASAVEHVIKLKATHCDTEDGELAKFIQEYLYFPRCRKENLSLSISSKVPFPDNFVKL